MIDFLITYNSDITFAMTFGGIALFLFLERIKPRRPESEQQTSRWLNNISITAFNFFLMSLVMVVISSSSWLNNIRPDTQVLDYFGLNVPEKIVVTIMLLEFTTYWLHRLMHIIPVLWRIHAVHHADIEMDVTTTHRHHPFEPVLVLITTLPVLILLGPPVLALILYNLLHIIVATVSHSNLCLSKSLDHWLRYLFITPDFHRVHHMSQKVYTDSNYGAIFPWFDYLFGTAKKIPYAKQETVKLGLSYFRKPLDSRIDQLLLIPFRWK